MNYDYCVSSKSSKESEMLPGQVMVTWFPWVKGLDTETTYLPVTETVICTLLWIFSEKTLIRENTYALYYSATNRLNIDQRINCWPGRQYSSCLIEEKQSWALHFECSIERMWKTIESSAHCSAWKASFHWSNTLNLPCPWRKGNGMNAQRNHSCFRLEIGRQRLPPSPGSRPAGIWQWATNILLKWTEAE